jgi:hypothetical protein
MYRRGGRRINMTEASYICKVLDSYDKSLTPLEKLEKFKEEYPAIKIKVEDNRLAIFNYGIGADFSDPVIQEARGIIIDILHNIVVCFPFRKFGKYNEYYADSINWEFARAEEKVDGSIVKFWYDAVIGQWRWSSNSCIDASDAKMEREDYLSIMDIIKMTKVYQNMHSPEYSDKFYKFFHPDTTYIFEVVSKYNRVIVKYDTPELYHIGTRRNIDGKEFRCEHDKDIYPGMKFPKVYHGLRSLESCIEYTNTKMNHEDGESSFYDVTQEGFVVVDNDFHRIKVKAPIYMILHSIITITEDSKAYLIEALKENEIDVTKMSISFPDYAHFLKYYDYQLSEFLYNARSMISIARRLYRESNMDRKFVALKIKEDKYSAIGFLAITYLDESEDVIIWEKFGMKKILKYIPDYEKLDRSYMFEQEEKTGDSLAEEITATCF